MIAIIGAGGHGKVVAEIMQITFPSIEIVIFDDDCSTSSFKTHWPVLGAVSDLDSYKKQIEGIIVAIGNNKIRLELSNKLKEQGYKLLTAIHPTASVSQFGRIGEGSVVMAGAIIGIDASIGNSVIINTGAIVEHDCVIGDSCHLSPNSAVAGGCKIGCNSWLGIGSSVKQLVRIGKSVVVGAGSVVIKDIGDHLTVVGVPAKPINIKE